MITHRSLCALAALRVRDPTLLTAFCERVAASLHSFTGVDAAKCLWAFCALGLAQARSRRDDAPR